MLTDNRTTNVYPLKDDVATISGLIQASYEVVSGFKGEQREWARDLSLHHPKAIYSYKNSEDKQVTIPISEFHEDTDSMIMETDFFEYEVHREVKVFGNIAQVWSTYETTLMKDGPVRRRGINSIQLVYEKDRWWIISWVFDKETDENRIPKTFDKH